MTTKIKKILHLLLTKQNIKAAQLARETGIAPQTIHNWLSGQEPKNLEQIKIVAEYFNVSIDYLCFGKKPYMHDEPFEDYKDEINAGIFEVILRRPK